MLAVDDVGSSTLGVDGVAAAAAAVVAVGYHQAGSWRRASKLCHVVESSRRTALVDRCPVVLYSASSEDRNCNRRRTGDLRMKKTSQASQYSRLQQLCSSAAVMLHMHIH